MAEASERPSEITTSPAARPLADEYLPATSEAPSAYRPLSMMALGGFALATLYALVVFGGGVVSFFNHTPLLLGMWSFLIPVAAGLLCGGARARIRSSEGTLGGISLANWGLGLSLFFGLSYLAYAGGTYFAVRQQANAFAESWLGQLRDRKLESAFVKTLKQTQQPAEDGNLRTLLETRFNEGGNPTSRGPLTRFRQLEFVRLLPQLGPDAKITLQGVRDWEYDKGGYRVQMIYHVASPVANCDLKVTVHGSEDRGGAYQGRRWMVLMEDTRLESYPRELADEKGEFRREGTLAREFASNWMKKVNERRWVEAYEDTLPAKERGKADPRVTPGFRAFREGSLLRNIQDPKTFWTRPKAREDILKELKDVFAKDATPPSRMVLDPTNPVPVWDRENGKSRFGYDVQIHLPSFYVVDALLFVEREGPADDPMSWRIAEIALVRGDTPAAANPQQMPQAPAPGMGGPPPRGKTP
jgi:hypothetical protein